MILQFLKYTAVGLSSSLVNVSVYNLFLMLLDGWTIPSPADFLIPQELGFIASVLWAFTASRRYVFNSGKASKIPWYKALLRMFVTYSFTGIVLSGMLSMVWVYIFDFPKEILPVLNDTICFPVAFFLNKYWTFRAA